MLTEENALWCLLALTALAAAFGAISYLGRDTFDDGSAR